MAVNRALPVQSLLGLLLACGLLMLMSGCGRFSAGSAPDAAQGVDWPPRLGKPYPDLNLVDQTGKQVQLSEFKGKVILVEPIGMSCTACNAFVGADRYGGWNAVTPQPGLASIETYFPQYTGGVSLDDSRLVYVQLILFTPSMGVPTGEDVRQWAEHFHVDRDDNHLVLAGTKALQGQAGYDMIPGFQLIDKAFILRSDSTGHQPHDDLFAKLLPMVPELLAED